ncbi:uncharacterized protein LOC114044280 [Vombatus ursinus]|uniref:uncharacterized protein LOC114044280 n=1 Tax=Vombatus ursinus TaxID=29139 RepID=UPI000FFD5D3D|nr:uncharacterized protein LOC114044280 [Vombatus ursinus]
MNGWVYAEPSPGGKAPPRKLHYCDRAMLPSGGGGWLENVFHGASHWPLASSSARTHPASSLPQRREHCLPPQRLPLSGVRFHPANIRHLVCTTEGREGSQSLGFCWAGRPGPRAASPDGGSQEGCTGARREPRARGGRRRGAGPPGQRHGGERRTRAPVRPEGKDGRAEEPPPPTPAPGGPGGGPGTAPAAEARPGGRLTVCECRLWLASIPALSGAVSSSSTLPAGGFSMNAIAACPPPPPPPPPPPRAGGCQSLRPPRPAPSPARPSSARPAPDSPQGPSAARPLHGEGRTEGERPSLLPREGGKERGPAHCPGREERGRPHPYPEEGGKEGGPAPCPGKKRGKERPRLLTGEGGREGGKERGPAPCPGKERGKERGPAS